MRKSPGASIMDYFETLKDPRIERNRRHKLLDIIAIAICATICGADSWVHVELFGNSKLEWFQSFPTEFRPMTPSERSSPGWTRTNSRVVSWNGPNR